ncbi:RICIN domain-containing protein [Actinoplanes aureus]|uniref:RICIN domain-containing protein n=1 Tax=Actinoplanes aureus TaxID=2792083 RepID=A0A931CCF8_9ACTN|nr:RICIN domain-containing protein [Actinoplanes aureus]MBG0567519.1 RICIN domain-containing protein [Actinoplanes aureus]
MPALLVAASPARADFTPSDGGAYYLRQFVSEKCLDVTAAQPGNGTYLQQWDCSPEWNQQFVFSEPGSPTGERSWKIKPRFVQSRCLDAKDGVHYSTRIQIWDCHVGWQQRWVVRGVRGYAGAYTLHAAYLPNYCLTIRQPSGGNGQIAETAPCNGTFGQMWRS